MIFPLWKDQGEEDEDAEAATDTGPIFVYGRAGIKLRLEWMQMSEGERPGNEGVLLGGGERQTRARILIIVPL